MKARWQTDLKAEYAEAEAALKEKSDAAKAKVNDAKEKLANATTDLTTFNEDTLAQYTRDLEALLTTVKDVEAYNTAIEKYNTAVEKYNALISGEGGVTEAVTAFKDAVDAYNKAVTEFNEQETVATYNQKVDDYNKAAEGYNQELEGYIKEVNAYNQSVLDWNTQKANENDTLSVAKFMELLNEKMVDDIKVYETVNDIEAYKTVNNKLDKGDAITEEEAKAYNDVIKAYNEAVAEYNVKAVEYMREAVDAYFNQVAQGEAGNDANRWYTVGRIKVSGIFGDSYTPDQIYEEIFKGGKYTWDAGYDENEPNKDYNNTAYGFDFYWWERNGLAADGKTSNMESTHSNHDSLKSGYPEDEQNQVIYAEGKTFNDFVDKMAEGNLEAYSGNAQNTNSGFDMSNHINQ